jgi:NAD(P)H-hydrate epimerase
MIPILTAAQIKEADDYTIANEPISSTDLMERAARACSERIISWLERGPFGYGRGSKVIIFCGPGNNGGDGAAIARHLSEAGHKVTLVRTAKDEGTSPDNREMIRRLKEQDVIIRYLDDTPIEDMIGRTDVVIDAIFGIGATRPIQGRILELVTSINSSGRPVISIDMPSGLFTEDNGSNDPKGIIRAFWTLTFEVPKPSLLLAVNIQFTGHVEVVPTGLDFNYINALHTDIYILEEKDVIPLIPIRPRAGHKGVFGHAMLIGGSAGKAGAAVLAVQATLRSGVGLVTVHSPSVCIPVLQESSPEAMSSTGGDGFITDLPKLDPFTAVGIGPGIGEHTDTHLVIKNLIRSGYTKLVMDADALNILSENPTWRSFLPANTILTPHPKEFDRLHGSTAANDHERLQNARQMAMKHGVIIVLKGTRTAICDPNGKVFFNVNGNVGMARGGSGDALTGLITGLLAQRLSPLQAAILGVYIHGSAGDICARERGMDGMSISEMIAAIPDAWKLLRQRSEQIFHGTFTYPQHFGITF